MSVFIGRDRKARRAYGFDEIALVPGDKTLNPEEVDIKMPLGKMTLDIPFLASAMDGVVDPAFAKAMEEEAQTRRAARTAHYGYDPSRVYSEM